MDRSLVEWLEGLREKGVAVNGTLMKIQAKKLSGSKRYGLSNRRKTSAAQKLPEDLEDKVLSFQRRMIQLREQYDYPMCDVFNMDKTPLTFVMPSDWTIDYTGKKDCKIKTTGAEKKLCTVMCAVTADGRKYPLNVIFRGKRKLGPRVIPPACKLPVWGRKHPLEDNRKRNIDDQKKFMRFRQDHVYEEIDPDENPWRVEYEEEEDITEIFKRLERTCLMTVREDSSEDEDECMSDFSHETVSDVEDIHELSQQHPDDTVLTTRHLQKTHRSHDTPVTTYILVPGASQRGKGKLISSDGYSYTFKLETQTTIHWQCAVRNKKWAELTTMMGQVDHHDGPN
ncbi:hypothetical protein Bbelb_051240 [Branchiostoma belcheri]|nr:hypothetical protein Bbelb_051240 [Branchiostoma belcheri]